MSHDHKSLSQASMKKGSKTFSLAARFFPQEEFESAAQIYFWCRSCDDYIDDKVASAEDVDYLLHQTFGSSSEPQFLAFKDICHKYTIPSLYPRELLEGMRMDALGETYETIKDLELYAYRAAGTVGLMMSHVMGLYDEKALSEAAKLGMAMQMTNIARDIKEDAERGRVYLPLSWLRAHNVDPRDLLNPCHKNQLFEVTIQLLEHADKLYKEGSNGVIHLPLKCALAITMAANFYQEIGREILQLGPDALSRRTIVSLERKIILMVKSVFQVLKTIPQRWSKKRETIQIQTLWRPT